MEFSDKFITCVECESTFVFTADEQLFFHTRQFAHEPKRCRHCRARRSMGRVKFRTETRIQCSQCGEETTVPFRPTKGLPVLCRACFQNLGNAVQPEPPAKLEANPVPPPC